MKVLILGATGMLGSAIFRLLSDSGGLDVAATVRSDASRRAFSESLQAGLIAGVDVENQDSMTRLMAEVRPDVVVNCIGLVKQLADADDPLLALPINAMLPHRLAQLTKLAGARLIHVSTDCVFSGTKGGYLETDVSDATDLYGKSKYIGEVAYSHTITLRTSIIGHQLFGNHSLINWFLEQTGPVSGYTKAIFSGLPTVELARVIRDYVMPSPELCGLYHVAAEPISKYDLLKLVAEIYGKDIVINPDDRFAIDRSLNAERFCAATGYIVPSWPDLIMRMREFH